MKPVYHISPEHGFLNDPNGLAKFRGEFHAFYQWLPEVTPRGPKRWRHCVSKDLIHWNDVGSSLEPTQWYEKDGCYSGSGVVDRDRYYLFYTGNVRDEQGGRESFQCAAVSQDGRQSIKLGPVVRRPRAYTPHFRDPKVWRKEGHWWMLVGAQTQELTGNAALFRSEDLLHWCWMGNALAPDLDLRYMCECPDLLEVDGKEFLMVSRQSEQGPCPLALAGRMDYPRGRFCTAGPGVPLDEGMDFYAPQSFTDEAGRRLLFGWLGSGDAAYQLSQPAAREGWLHSLTIPRELFVRGGALCQRPAEELKQLRREEQQTESAGTMTLNRGTASLELLAEGLGGQEVSFDFGSVLKLHYRPETRAMQVMRKKWDAEGYDEKSINLARLDTLQVYLDQSTAELFVNQGEKVLTFKAYFGRDTGVKIGSEKKSGCQLEYWRYHNGTDSGLSIGGPPDY